MPVGAYNGPDTYTGTGVASSYAYNFKITDETHLRVTIDGTVQTLTTHYTVTGVGNANGGNVVPVSAAHFDGEIVIERVVPYTRTTDFQRNNAFDEETVDGDFDRATMQIQQLKAITERAVLAPAGETLSELPSAADRASTYFAFDASGDPMASAAQSGSPTSAFMATVLDDTTAAAARTTLGLAAAKELADDIVSVKDPAYGATGDGVTDDTAAVNASLASNLAVYFPPGNYLCGTLTLRSGHRVFGAGQGNTTITLKSGTNASLLSGANVTDVSIASLTLDGNSAGNLTGGGGVSISGTSAQIRVEDVRATDFRYDGIGGGGTIDYFDVINCRADGNLRDGVTFTGITHANVSNSRAIDNGRFGVVFGTGCNFARLSNNILSGNSATDASGAGALAISCTDVTFHGNIAEGNVLGHGLQFNTITRGVMTGNISRGNGISGLDSYASAYVTIVGNQSYLNAVRGIEIDSAAYYNTVGSNIVTRNAGAGISVYRSPGTIVTANHCQENGTGATETYGIRLWDDLNTLPSGGCRLIANACADDRGGSATQTYGIKIEAASTTNVVVIGNNLSPNVSGPISAVSGSVSAARDNTGWVTQADGVSSIASGTTSTIVNHGLAGTPPYGCIQVNLANAGSNDPAQLWLSNITSTQFTLNCRNDPGAGGITFGWSATLYA